jgi:MraZ protein
MVPSSYRKSIEEKETDTALYLETDPHKKCIKVYPKSFWDKNIATLKSRLNLWDNNDQQIFRQYNSRVERVEFDSNGRILLQRKKLDAIGVKSEIVINGMIDYFELWLDKNLDNTSLSNEDFDKAIQMKMGNNELIIE